jgi:Flp pilus assembly pilin Flp
MKFWKELWSDESGAVATEYVIMVGLIAIALIATVIIFKDKIVSLFGTFESGLDVVDKEATQKQ